MLVSGIRWLSEVALRLTKKQEARRKVGKWDGVMNDIVFSVFCLPDEAESSRHVTMGRGKKKYRSEGNGKKEVFF